MLAGLLESLPVTFLVPKEAGATAGGLRSSREI